MMGPSRLQLCSGLAPRWPCLRPLRPRGADLRTPSSQALRHRKPSRRQCTPAAISTHPGGAGDNSPAGSALERLAAAANALTAMATNLFPVWVLGAAAWALTQPAAFAWFHKGYIASALTVTMLGLGATLTSEECKKAITAPRQLAARLALQFLVLTPATSLLITRASGLPLEYNIGLVLVGSCLGGTASNVVAFLGKADVTLSAMLTTATTLGAVLATPMAAQLMQGTLARVDAVALLTSVLQVALLPALAGASLSQAYPSTTPILRPLCALAAVALNALICGSAVRHSARALTYSWPAFFFAVAALLAGGFGLGYAFSRGLSLPTRTAPAGQEAGAASAHAATLLAAWRTHMAAAMRNTASTGMAALRELPQRLKPKLRPPPSSSSHWRSRLQEAQPPAPAPAAAVAAAAVAAPPAPPAPAPVAAAVAAPPPAIYTPPLPPPPPPAHAASPLPRAEPAAPAAAAAQQQTPTQQGPKLTPSGVEVMNIVMVGAECAPWSKTGGLGDVMQALPKALADRGHRVMVVAPRYKLYKGAENTGVRLKLRVCDTNQEVRYFRLYQDGVDYVFVDHACYQHLGDHIYSGSPRDVQFRCALLSKAALEAPWHVPCKDRQPYGDANLLFVANDWHTALLPVYLQAHYRDHGKLQFARSLLVLHNVAHQGRAPLTDLHHLEVPEHYRDLFRLDHEGEHMNILKAGSITAHRIVAVSEGYALECQTPEGGFGLNNVLREQGWKLKGVVNGIDYNEWHPAVDPHLQSSGYTNYDVPSLGEGKAMCKAALQRELGLPVDPDIPLLGFIGRLDQQKGVDLIRDNYEWLMGEGVQLVMLGSGREDLEDALRDMERRHRSQCRGWVGFSVKMAHRITAGVDMLLMPSRFEPCGLNQLYAMAYGTTPIVHAVGGLKDTVKPFHPYDNAGTGWTFEPADAGAFRKAIGNALLTYRQHKESFRAVQLRGMEQDLSWDGAAQQYEEVLLAAKYQW